MMERVTKRQSQARDEEVLEGWLRQVPTGYRQSPTEEGGLHGQGVSWQLGPPRAERTLGSLRSQSLAFGKG